MNFLTLKDLSKADLEWILARAAQKSRERTLPGKLLGLVFEKPSTRTRVSFEAGMAQLGGQAMVLPQSESQSSRGEPLKDTARVLSRYLDAIVMRTFSHDRIVEMAQYATVPVINGLTGLSHPCQLLADLQTVLQHKGKLGTIAFVGDGATNMALSWIEAAEIFGFELRIAAPKGYQPPPNSRVLITTDPKVAVKGADVVNTDVWTSMGQEQENTARMQAFSGFIVDDVLMTHAKADAIVMHCLPAHRGEEIAESVLEGPQSVVWDQAENRMHAQKALLELLLGKKS